MELSHLIADNASQGTFLVHRSALTSKEIFELERERIFDRCWLYVGHDSEIPNPGDFRRRTVAERPLFMVRGADAKIRVFLNTCRHRGALVCQQDEGNAESFMCFYHGWSYNAQGELTGVPDLAGYGEGFNLAERGLAEPPHVDSYRGMIFVNFGSGSPSLADYLGEAREIIDLTMDSAELLGGWKIIGGSAKYNIRANWKLLAENSIDGYHLPTVHQTYLEYMSYRGKLAGVKKAKADRDIPTHGFALNHGHVGMLHPAAGRPIASPSPIWSAEAAAEVAQMRERLAERFGPERGYSMADTSRHLVIFPNVAFQDSQTGFRIRQWWPKGPDLLEVTQWELIPREEREDIRAYRMEGALAFLGPGGLATPDDVEALESCQIGFKAREMEWSDISRGTQRDARMNDEQQMRGFWRQWHALIQGQGNLGSTADQPHAKPAAEAKARSGRGA
jgi:p-cumate 2,3-dioxygenase alpha subunit